MANGLVDRQHQMRSDRMERARVTQYQDLLHRLDDLEKSRTSIAARIQRDQSTLTNLAFQIRRMREQVEKLKA